MSTYARASSTAVVGRPLARADIADLLHLAVQQCGRSDAPSSDLREVMALVGVRRGREVSEAVLCQVADAVVAANQLPPIAGDRDPLVAVAAAVMSAAEKPADALHALLVEAWMAYDPELRGDGMPESARVEDLERAELERLTLAGRYFLLAHDAGGELLVSEQVCALGLAGALLAEVLLAGAVRFVPTTGVLAARTVAVPSMVSVVAEDVAARLREPRPTRVALEFTAAGAYVRVRGELLLAGVLVPRDARRLLRPPVTLFPPVRPRLPERVFNSVTALASTNAAELALDDAALIALARATGLATASGRQWWMARDIPAEQAVSRNPGLGCLIAQVGAVVTKAVAVRQR